MPKNFLTDNITSIISIARLAPSVHNAQPWRVRAHADSLLIYPNSEPAVIHGDPTGRQKSISIGIFTEACVISLAYHGLLAKGVTIDDRGTVKIVVATGKKAHDISDVEALKHRFTDRSIFKRVAITANQMKLISDSWSSRNVEVRTTSDSKILKLCAQLTKQGLSIALSSPDFRKELASYLVPNKKSPYGIPMSTLGAGKVQSRMLRKMLTLERVRDKEAQREYERWLSASGVVFILAKGDTPEFWLEAGRAYLRAALAIQKTGLHQATSAAIVEAADFHEDIEKELKTDMRLLCLIRIGYSQAKYRPSGRFKSHELILT